MCKYFYFPSLLKGFAKREILSLELIFLNKNLYEISLLLIFFFLKSVLTLLLLLSFCSLEW